MKSAPSCDSLLHNHNSEPISDDFKLCGGPCIVQNALEREYVALYSELHVKLRRILCLNKFISAAKSSPKSVHEEAETIEKTLSPVTTNHADFLRHQSSIVIDKTLFNNFLQLSAPVTRAVHYNSNDLSASEQNINHIMTQLYSIDPIEGKPRGDAFRFMQALENLMPAIHSAALHMQKVRNTSAREQSALLENERQLRVELNAKHAKIKVGKSSAFCDADGHDIRSRYLKITELWALASKTATFLQLWISTLPFDWYADETLRKLMDKTQDISSYVDELELIVSSRTLHEYSDEQLIMLDLAEINF